MSNKVILGFILILAILSPALTSNDSAMKMAGFTSFVANPIVHLAEAKHSDESHDLRRQLKPSHGISRKAYLAGYKTLSETHKAKARARLNEIRAQLKALRVKRIAARKAAWFAAKKASKGVKKGANGAKGAEGHHKKLASANGPKTNAQKGALRHGHKKHHGHHHHGHYKLTKEERKSVRAQVKQLFADRKLRRAARKSAAKPATEKHAKKTHKKLSKEERKSSRPGQTAQLAHIAKSIYRRRIRATAIAKAVLGWEDVLDDTRKKLIKEFPKKHTHHHEKKADHHDKQSGSHKKKAGHNEKQAGIKEKKVKDSKPKSSKSA